MAEVLGIATSGVAVARIGDDFGSEDSGGSGVALLLLLLLVLGGVWVFRRVTSGTDTSAVQPESDFEATPTLRIAIGSLLGASLLGLVLPVLASDISDSGKLSDAGGETVMYFLVAWGFLAFGGFAAWKTREGTALAQGAAIAFGGYLIFLSSAFWALVHLSEGYFHAGAGLIFLSLGAALAVWVVAIRRMPGLGRGAHPLAGWHIGLLIGGCLAALGIMLPPNDSSISFSQKNFEWEPGLLQITWLIFVASIVAPSVLAYRARTRAGLRLALGALGPTVWMALASIIDSNQGFDGDPGTFDQVHPLFLVGVVVQVIVVGVAWSKVGGDDAAVDAPSMMSDPAATSARGASAPPIPDTAPLPPPTMAPPATELPVEPVEQVEAVEAVEPVADAVPETAPEVQLSEPPTGEPSAPVGPADSAAPASVQFATEGWTTDQFRSVRDLLTERGIAFDMVDGQLQVDADAQLAAERVIGEAIGDTST